jgi:serine/threonine-protein kinase
MAYGGEREALAGVREGEVLVGKYRIDRILGVGGMGVVVAARNLQLDTKVALKFLLPDVLANGEAVARFTREARAAARILNEHVARVHDVGTLDNGAPYIVMEFLEGEDLGKWIHQRGPLSVEHAADFMLQACVAVADAHALGIVHRDLKPANLFCVRRSDGQFLIKVLDFGISKLTDLARASEPPGMSATKTATVMGTPLYMSPEQIQSAKDVDARTDIWALGVIVFELLTGTVPFPGDAFGEIAVKVSTAPTPSLRAYRPDVAPALDSIVGRCLEKDRNRRFAHVGELAVALLPFAPKRSRASVERITGIMQAAGLSAPAPLTPPFPEAGSQTLPAQGSSVLSSGSTKSASSFPRGPTTARAVVATTEGGRTRAFPVMPVVAGALVISGAGTALLFTPKQASNQRAAAPEPSAARSSAPAPSAEPPASSALNPWIQVTPPSGPPVRLGVDDERSSDLGFRPSRGIVAPSSPYAIQQHEVTWQEIDPWLAAHPESRFQRPPGVPGDAAQRSRLPAVGISWPTALAYCRSLGGKLPTEEQWEYAARGPDRRPNPWGSEALDLGRTHAYAGVGASVGPVWSADQDQTPGEPSQAIDGLAGNALEWTLDLFRDDRPNQDESWVEADGLSYRAVRGLPLAEKRPKELPRTSAAYRQALCVGDKCPAETAKEMATVGFRCVKHGVVLGK